MSSNVIPIATNRGARDLLTNKNLANSNRSIQIYEMETVGVSKARHVALFNRNLDNAGDDGGTAGSESDKSWIYNKTLNMADPCFISTTGAKRMENKSNRNVQAARNRNVDVGTKEAVRINDVTNVDRQLTTRIGGLTITELEVVDEDAKPSTVTTEHLVVSDNRGWRRPCREPEEDDEEATASDDDVTDESDSSSGGGSDIQQRGPMGGRYPKAKFHPYGEASPTSPGASSDSSNRSSSPEMSPPPPPHNEMGTRSPVYQSSCHLNPTRLTADTGGVCIIYPTTPARPTLADVMAKSPASRASLQMAGGCVTVSKCAQQAVNVFDQQYAQIVPQSPMLVAPTYDPVSPSVYEEVEEQLSDSVTLTASFQQSRETAELSPYSSTWSASSPSTTDSPPGYPVSPEDATTCVSDVGFGFFSIGSPSKSAVSSYYPPEDATATSKARRRSRETPTNYVRTTEQEPLPLEPTRAPLTQADVDTLAHLEPYMNVNGEPVIEKDAFNAFIDFMSDELASASQPPIPASHTWPQMAAQPAAPQRVVVAGTPPAYAQRCATMPSSQSHPGNLSPSVTRGCNIAASQACTTVSQLVPENSQAAPQVSATTILVVFPPPLPPSRYRTILPKVGATTSLSPVQNNVPMSSVASLPAHYSLMPSSAMNRHYPNARERFRATLDKRVLDDVSHNVDRLLAEELQRPDAKGDTKLHISTANGNHEWTYAIVERLRNENLSVNKANNLGQTPLFNAVCNNNPLVVSYLLENRADPSCRCCDNNTPLHVVAQCGKEFLEVGRILCEVRNISLNGTNTNGYSPLHRAVQEHKPQVDTLPIIELLLQSGANLDVTDLCSGRTALYMAVEKGSLELVQTICRFCEHIGATINFSTYSKDSVLHAAALLNHLGEEKQMAILEVLLRHGADVHVKNLQSKYPKDLVDKRHKKAKKMLAFPRR